MTSFPAYIFCVILSNMVSGALRRSVSLEEFGITVYKIVACIMEPFSTAVCEQSEQTSLSILLSQAASVVLIMCLGSKNCY